MSQMQFLRRRRTGLRTVSALLVLLAVFATVGVSTAGAQIPGGYTTSGAPGDEDGDGIPDDLANEAANATYGTCTNLVSYTVGTPFTLDIKRFKSKFDTTKGIVVATFSTPVVLYRGAWPANDTLSLTSSLTGTHKIVVFGTDENGEATYTGCRSTGKGVDADGDGVSDVLAAEASNAELATCSNFGPYVVGQPTPYPLAAFKAKFDTTKPITIGMFSTFVVMYQGAWPTGDVATITPTLAGNHKFVVFGVDSDGDEVYAGCVANSKTDVAGTSQSPNGASSGNTGTASTGANVGSATFLGAALIVVGGLLVLAFGRRRREATA